MGSVMGVSSNKQVVEQTGQSRQTGYKREIQKEQGKGMKIETDIQMEAKMTIEK